MGSTVPADLLKLKARLEAWRATRKYARREHSAPRFDIQRHAFLVHLAPFNSRERVAGSRG